MKGREAISVSARQLSCYLGIGVATMGVYAAANAFLLLVLKIPPSVAAGLAVAISSIFNYFGHMYLTFQSQRPIRSSLPRYVLLLLVNSVLAAVLVKIGMDMLGLSLTAANGLALVFVTATSFVIMKYGVMGESLSTRS